MTEDKHPPNDLDSRLNKDRTKDGLLAGSSENGHRAGAPTSRPLHERHDGLNIEDVPDDIAALLDAEEAADEDAPDSDAPDSQESSLHGVGIGMSRRDRNSDPDESEEAKRTYPTSHTPGAMLVKLLRWVLLIPLSLVSGIVCFYAVQFGNRLTLPTVGVDPEDILVRPVIELLAGGACYAAFVRVGHRVAPSHKYYALYGLVGVALFITGSGIVLALKDGNYWPVIRHVGGVLGIGITLESVRRTR